MTAVHQADAVVGVLIDQLHVVGEAKGTGVEATTLFESAVVYQLYRYGRATTEA